MQHLLSRVKHSCAVWPNDMRFALTDDELMQIGLKPKWWQWLTTALNRVAKARNLQSIKGLPRSWRVNRLEESLELNSGTFPPIELLIVVAGKDMEMLPIVISSALRFSMNPIHKISIICPRLEVRACKLLLSKMSYSGKCDILSEDKVIDSNRRDLIAQKFPDRYGWVLQQFLALEFIFNSKEDGILLLNSDTILLRNVHWLDAGRNQILMSGTDFHKPYYELLGKIFGVSKKPVFTFVTHHMLFQPEFLREIFENRGYKLLSSFLEDVVFNADPFQNSPLCVEFEHYAQGIRIDFPHHVSIRKFGNISKSRTQENMDYVVRALEGKQELNYNSVSLHDYL